METLITQDQVIANCNDGILPTGRTLAKQRAALRAAMRELGHPPIHMFGPRDVRYKLKDIDHMMATKQALAA